MIVTTGKESHSFPYQVRSWQKLSSSEFQKPLTALSGKNKQDSAKEKGCTDQIFILRNIIE